MINIESITWHSDAWWTLIGLGCAALIVILVLLFMKWESKRATNKWEKRNNSLKK